MHGSQNVRLAFTSILSTALIVSLLGATPARAQKYAIVGILPDNPHSIDNPADSQIVQGRNGEVYATSTANGAVLSATTSGNFAQVSDSTGGGVGVILGADGNLYVARNDNNGCGDVYRVTPSGTTSQLAALCGNDGTAPGSAPIEASNGIFYGTAGTGGTSGDGTIYSLTGAGVLKVLHTFTGPDGSSPSAPLTVGSDGNFYGGTQSGGKNNDGVLFRITPSGAYSVLHYLAGTDGQGVLYGLVRATDGNLYGVANTGGSDGEGVFFKLTNSGAYSALFSFPHPYSSPSSSLVQGTDGKLYGLLGQGNSSQPGWIYSITTSGTFTILHEFCQQVSQGVCTDGGAPTTPLIQHTDGKFYGFTASGGTAQCSGGTGCGVFYSLDMALSPFLGLSTTSGSVGSTVGLFGQGFDSASAVKFNSVAATKIVLSGTTYIAATVPAGATDGKVTVTTGTSTLTSAKNFTVHNTWSKGKAMPTATVGSSSAVVNGQIYVIGGANASGAVISTVQIYNPATNAWSTGTPLPDVNEDSSAAVVNGILYVFGGDNGVSPPTNAVWAYNPATKKWTGQAAMLTARNGTLAVVENNIVYVIGGNIGGGPNFVGTVESYDPATNEWKTEASMDGAKDFPGGGLIGSTIVVADGAPAGSAVTGDTEAYSATTNKWTELTADPTARTGACSGAINGLLYDASGYINNAGAATTINESFNMSTNKWTTTLVNIPQGTMFPASVVDNGRLYCFGGWAIVNATAINNVQIYQP